MDRPLSADRFSSGPGEGAVFRGNYNDGRGGDGRRYGGRGRGYRGGGGGGGRGGYRGGRNRGRYHEPYGRGRGGSRYGRGGGSGGNEPRGNRFYAEPQLHDPRSMLLKQLNELLHQVGQLPTENNSGNDGKGSPDQQQFQPQRWVVQTMAQNVMSLSKVLCSKADLFLQAQSNSPDASIAAGPLASGLVQAAAVGPLQTPCYAALALAVQQQDSLSNSALVDGSASEFAQRTVQFAVRLLAQDLDALLLVEPPVQQAPPDFSLSRGNTPPTPEPVVRLAQRVRLVLRYLGLLSQLGMVRSALSNDGEENMGFDPVVVATNHQAVSYDGLLQSIVQAACLLHRGGGGGSDDPPRPDLAVLLAYIVYSTIPYLVLQSSTTAGEQEPFWQEQIVQPLQAILETYQSDFEPGVGPKAILLKYEQLDDKVGQDEEEEEEDDEDEDDEDDGSPNPVCDNLQDLHRCVQSLLSSLPDQNPYRFALFTDAPWKSLFKPKEDSDGMDAKAEGESEEAPAPDEPLLYTGEALSLPIFPECLSLTFILGGPVAVKDAAENAVLASRINLDGVLVGRLPIFGSPRDSNDDDDEDDDDMDEGPKNERLETYSKTYGLVDRYFLGEAVRDCLISHEPKVTETGVERGNVKAAAEQVWSVAQLLLSEKQTPSNGDASGENANESSQSTQNSAAGFEFVVVEVLLSLIVQSSSDHDTLGLSYLSRVLLELVKLEPVPMAAATVHAVATFVEDYMPSLVPHARRNLGQWFAFHLIHSNYQWPADYWNHWEPFVRNGWKNSRGGFIKESLAIMMENVTDPMVLLSQIPNSLGETLVPAEGPSVPPQVDTLIQDLSRRIHDMNEDPSTVLVYLASDELQESLTIELQAETNEQHRSLWRTKAVARALLMPLYLENEIFRTTLLTKLEERQNDSGGDDAMEEEPEIDSSDALAQIVAHIPQYRSLVEGAIAKDIEGENSSEIPFYGEGVLMDQIAELADYSQPIFTFVLQLFAEEKLVTPMGALRWFLGGNNDSSFRSDVAAKRWFENCAKVIQVPLRELFAATTDYGHMILDDNEDAKTKPHTVRNAETFLEFASPLLKFAVARAHALLLASGVDSEAKKLTPQDIVVMEGCKQLVKFTKETYFSSLKDACASNNQGYFSEVLEIFQASALTGQSLASLCSSSDTNSTKLLVQSLERS